MFCHNSKKYILIDNKINVPIDNDIKQEIFSFAEPPIFNSYNKKVLFHMSMSSVLDFILKEYKLSDKPIYFFSYITLNSMIYKLLNDKEFLGKKRELSFEELTNIVLKYILIKINETQLW